MRALTVRPRQPRTAEVRDVAEPAEDEGDLLVETLAVGICGTDLEIVAGEYGDPPPGEELLVLGHESLGRVLEPPPESSPSGLRSGDLVEQQLDFRHHGTGNDEHVEPAFRDHPCW